MQTSPDGNQVENEVIRAIELKIKIQNDIIDLECEKDKMIREVHEIDNSEYVALLYKRYMEFKRLEVIALEMDYSYDYARELHGKALQNFESYHTIPQNDVL